MPPPAEEAAGAFAAAADDAGEVELVTKPPAAVTTKPPAPVTKPELLSPGEPVPGPGDEFLAGISMFWTDRWRDSISDGELMVTYAMVEYVSGVFFVRVEVNVFLRERLTCACMYVYTCICTSCLEIFCTYVHGCFPSKPIPI